MFNPTKDRIKYEQESINKKKEIIKRLKALGINALTNYSITQGDITYTFDILATYKNKKVLINYNNIIDHNIEFTIDEVFDSNINEEDYTGLDRRYHLNQSIFAEENDYELIQWFPHYDTNKMLDLVKSKLGANTSIIYARKCKLKEVDRKVAKKFVNDNHVLGLKVNCPFNFGLYYNDELISVMSFRKLKKTKENSKETSDFEHAYELFRYCNKTGYGIIGGAAKLFKNFCKQYDPTTIKTLSDYNWGFGHVYKNLGFECNKKLQPSIFWSDPDVPETFINNNLMLIGADRIIPKYRENYFHVGMDEQDFIRRGGLQEYGSWVGNIQIFQHYGFVRILDSGYKTWWWHKN